MGRNARLGFVVTLGFAIKTPRCVSRAEILNQPQCRRAAVRQGARPRAGTRGRAAADTSPSTVPWAHRATGAPSGAERGCPAASLPVMGYFPADTATNPTQPPLWAGPEEDTGPAMAGCPAPRRRPPGTASAHGLPRPGPPRTPRARRWQPWSPWQPEQACMMEAARGRTLGAWGGNARPCTF